MNYFSLFSGASIRRSSAKKILQKEEVETLLQAKELLDTTAKDALTYKKSIVEECETLKEEAEKAGFQKGLETLHKHNLHLQQLVQTLRDELQEKILPLALKAAKKILGEELKLHPDRIVDIVMQSLKPVIQSRSITIYVNRKDLTRVESKKSKIRKMLEQVENLVVTERPDVEEGGCVIETESGIINAQLENQWRALERAFTAFMEEKNT